MPFGAFDVGDGYTEIGEISDFIGVHISDRKIGIERDKKGKKIYILPPFTSEKRGEVYREFNNFVNFRYMLSVYYNLFHYKDRSCLCYHPPSVVPPIDCGGPGPGGGGVGGGGGG